MNFSALPCLRWPIVHYWSFLQHWFAASQRAFQRRNCSQDESFRSSQQRGSKAGASPLECRSSVCPKDTTEANPLRLARSGRYELQKVCASWDDNVAVHAILWCVAAWHTQDQPVPLEGCGQQILWQAPAGEFRQNHKNRVCKSGADLEAWLWKNLFDF